MTDSGMKIDLHMHMTVSDGTDRPEEIPAIVEAAGIGVFSVTDHDDVRDARILSSLTRSGGPGFITGIELSAEDAALPGSRLSIQALTKDCAAKPFCSPGNTAFTSRRGAIITEKTSGISRDIPDLSPRTVIPRGLSAFWSFSSEKAP